MTKEEARSQLFTEIALAAPNVRAQKALEVYADAYAQAAVDAALSDTLGMLEALAKTRREASWGGFPEDLMVHWTPETGFEYFSGTKGKLTREQARAEAEALLEEKEKGE